MGKAQGDFPRVQVAGMETENLERSVCLPQRGKELHSSRGALTASPGPSLLTGQGTDFPDTG